jgi:archaemetzincin
MRRLNDYWIWGSSLAEWTLLSMSKTVVRWIAVALVVAGIVLGSSLWVAWKTGSGGELNLPFVPPSETQRSEAIGDLLEIDDSELKKAFSPSKLFDPIPKPGRGDWLSSHRESGQTFARFLQSEPNRVDSNRNVIYLLPLGAWGKGAQAELELLREFSEIYFGITCQLLPELPIEEKRFPFKGDEDSGQRQLYTDDALKELKREVPANAFAMLAITQIDLVPRGNWNFVFGQASLSDRMGLFSFARFDRAIPDHDSRLTPGQLILRRRLGILAHEIGHMFGVPHCIYFHCVMNGSNSLVETDRAPLHPCPLCLRKLHHGNSFDPIERERNLIQFYHQVGLSLEANWHEQRLHELESRVSADDNGR